MPCQTSHSHTLRLRNIPSTPTTPPTIQIHTGLYWLCCQCHKLNGLHRQHCVWRTCKHLRELNCCWVGRMEELPDVRSNPDAWWEIQTVHPKDWWRVRTERILGWAKWMRENPGSCGWGVQKVQGPYGYEDYRGHVWGEYGWENWRGQVQGPWGVQDYWGQVGGR